MDEIYQRLIQSAGVPVEAQEPTLAKIRALKREYPNETPARLFARARKAGAPIPPSRCNHGVMRGECVACDKRIGARQYFTTGGSQVHTNPTCRALLSDEGNVVEPGSPLLIEAVRPDAGVTDTRDPCKQCVPVRTSTATARPRVAKVAPRRVAPLQGPTPLVESKPPTIGDQIEWGGYTGVVSEITEGGVRFAMDGISLTAPWGDRARVRKSRQDG